MTTGTAMSLVAGETVSTGQREKHKALKDESTRCQSGVEVKPADKSRYTVDECVLRLKGCR